jgi:threonine aldolase
MNKRGFASDNNSGVHPLVLKAIELANSGHVVGYGDDIYTQQAIELFKDHFGDDTEVFFTFNGTGANVLAIDTLTQAFHSVICPSTAHILVDECGAPEKITGCKLIPVETPDGKITPELISTHLHGFGFEHHSQPKLISISQTTELGTLYTVEEIKAITILAHQHNMFVHLDGARISNAAVALGLPFKKFTRDAGIDVVSFGGTKNGLMFGEAVLFFNKELTKNTKYFRKQNTQLYSKMRFIAAQFIAYFNNNLWLDNASHANKMAKLLANKVDKLGISISQKVEANGVFAIIDEKTKNKLLEKFFFYPWNNATNEVRWMTSFDTTEEDIESFCALLKQIMNE